MLSSFCTSNHSRPVIVHESSNYYMRSCWVNYSSFIVTTRQSSIRPPTLRCALPSPSSRRQAMRPIVNMTEEDRATDIGNMHKKFGKDRARVSRDILADIQTHRQTDRQRLITTFRNWLTPVCLRPTVHITLIFIAMINGNEHLLYNAVVHQTEILEDLYCTALHCTLNTHIGYHKTAPIVGNISLSVCHGHKSTTSAYTWCVACPCIRR